MSQEIPTIKGAFVMSHIEVLRKLKGEAGVRELERRLGAPVRFGRLEDVPVHTEVRIIELVLDLTSNGELTGTERALEAGRLHFRNFATTTFGGRILSSLPRSPGAFRTLLYNSGSIGRSVFKHTNFRITERRKLIVVTVENSDYPLEHFQGFFEEWMRQWKVAHPEVGAKEISSGTFEYTLKV